MGLELQALGSHRFGFRELALVGTRVSRYKCWAEEAGTGTRHKFRNIDPVLSACCGAGTVLPTFSRSRSHSEVLSRVSAPEAEGVVFTEPSLSLLGEGEEVPSHRFSPHPLRGRQKPPASLL